MTVFSRFIWLQKSIPFIIPDIRSKNIKIENIWINNMKVKPTYIVYLIDILSTLI